MKATSILLFAGTASAVAIGKKKFGAFSDRPIAD
jgi:hypothetical protein